MTIKAQPKLYRYSDGNTYTDNLTLAKAHEFVRLQGGGTVTAMDKVTKAQGKHTPGPWHLNTSIRSNLYVETYNERMPFICDMQLSVAAEDDKDEIEANARLIAAAPELLALAQLVAAGNTEFADLERVARAAIAKAEGKADGL